MLATQSVNSLSDAPPKAAPPLSAPAQRYRDWLRQRPLFGELIPEVADLLDAGKLHTFDAERIARLKPESQWAAARKCMKSSFTVLVCSVERSTITHGTPRSLGQAS